MDSASLIIAILALCVSLSSALWSYLRARKESTIQAYTLFQKEVVPDIVSIKDGFKRDGIDLSRMNNTEISNVISSDIRITVCLARIEYFCVGVNMRIYSIKTLNRMGGSFFCDLFDTFRPIIQVKRTNNKLNGKHYDEFERCVNQLKCMRSRSRYYRS